MPRKPAPAARGCYAGPRRPDEPPSKEVLQAARIIQIQEHAEDPDAAVDDAEASATFNPGQSLTTGDGGRACGRRALGDHLTARRPRSRERAPGLPRRCGTSEFPQRKGPR
eukprot:6692125-Alexandrium_andersonii.AAC.1